MSLPGKYAFTLLAALAAGSCICSRAQKPVTAEANQIEAQKLPSARQRREAEKIYLAGAKALEHEDLKTADEDFERAVDLAPGNQQYQAAREIARQHRVTALVQAADKARLPGHEDEARGDLVQAFHLDP